MKANIFLIILCAISFESSSSFKRSDRKRIYNGDPVKFDDFKYVVAIIDRRTNALCTGGIIDKSFVLTAAHCFVDNKTNEFSPNPITVFAGTDDLRLPKPMPVMASVDKIYIPEAYNASDKFTSGDVAVVKIKGAFDLSENSGLDALTLPSASLLNCTEDKDEYRSEEAVVAGFGNGQSNDIDKNSSTLSKLYVRVVNSSICEEETGFTRPNFFCARSAKSTYGYGILYGACKGDSGAPLVSSKGVAIGVLIGGSTTCDEFKKPGIYEKIKSYLKFIENAMKDKEIGMRSVSFLD